MWKTLRTKQDAGLDLVVAFSGGAASFVGLLALSGWITGLRVLASIRSDYIPMSPDTALAFVLLGLILILHVRTQERGWSKLFVSAIIAFVSIYGLLKSTEYFVNADLTFENILFPATEKFGSFFIKRMSPITGVLFFLSGLALQLKLLFGTSRKISNVISSLGVITLTAGFVATIGYVFGTPLLYGGAITPLAATTTIGFFLLGFGLVAIAGPENIFLQLFISDSASGRLLRFFLPMTILAILVQGFLIETLTHSYGLNHALASALLSLAFAILMSAVVVQLSKLIFRRADIAEAVRKRAEKEIESLSRFPAENPNPILRVKNDGQIIYANTVSDVLLRLWKCTVGKKLPPDWRERVVNAARDGARSTEEVACEERIYSIMIAPIPDAGYVNLYGLDITERKRSVEALEESEEQFRIITENSADAIFITDSQGRYLYVNTKAVNLLGYSKEEMLTFTIVDISPKNRVDEYFQTFQQILQNGSGVAEMDLVKKDGNLIPIDLNAVLLPNGFVYGSCRDITGRKRAEEALRTSEEKFRNIFEHSVVGISMTTLDGMLKTNKAFCEILGYSEDTLSKLRWQNITHPDDIERDQKIINSVASGEKESARWEKRYIHKNGHIVSVDISTALQRDNEGKPLYFVTAINDITERKRAEETLKGSEARYRRLFETARDGILILDAQSGMVVDVNPFLVEMLGYSREQFLGKRIYDLGFLKDIAASKTKFTELKKKEFIQYKNLPLETAKGQLINVEFVSHVYQVDRHKVIQCNIRDITERKRAEETRKSLEEQLQQAQKLESIGTLASGIAHDFNNILGIILGYSTLLEHLGDLPQEFLEGVQAITSATKRGASLVKQLLIFARKTEALLETVSINNLIGEFSKLLQETFPKTIIISTSLQQDLPTIVADASQIHQVLLNLCLNARDAMPKSGTLSISTKTIEGQDVCSRFAKATARQYVRIEISDTGIGMDDATRQRVFEPFFTTKGPGKGTGLGLAVVFGIIEHHSGFIDVRSAPGKGTSFTIYLPIPEHRLEEMQPIKMRLEEIPGGTETILIIEDEERLRKLVKASLVSKGYTVLAAEDGIQGVEMYRSHQKEIAVVLSDVGLPLLNGQDVFRRIREINPEAKVIFASGFFDPETKSQMYRAGLKNFIQKPYIQDEVLQKIREAIDTNG